MEQAALGGYIQRIRIVMARKYDSASDIRKYTTPERKAVYYEVSYYLSGNGSVTINGTEYKIHPGDVRFVRPGDRVFSTVHFSCLTVFFEFVGGAELNENQLFREIKPFFCAPKRTEELFFDLVGMKTHEKAEARLMQYSLLFQILSLLCKVNAAPCNSPKIEQCIAYMNEHLGEDITLHALGELVGYSSLHLRRLFLAATGMSPHEYLAELRLSHAKLLLMQTDLPIEFIAEECGYRSVAHFKTMFKKRVQITPGRFRRETE